MKNPKNSAIIVSVLIIVAALSSALPDWMSRLLFAGKANKYRKR